ncbi:MAG: carboxypeptidase regulatory-like domain-containing protein [Flavobacteriales bacterium]
MKKTILFLVLLCNAICGLNAQDGLTQTVKGTVTDLDADYPMIGVNVIWLNGDNSKFTTTDVNGNFSIAGIAVGRQSFEFTFIGYKNATIPNVLVNSAKETVLNVALEEELNKLTEAVVQAESEKGKAENDLAAVSSRSLSMDEVSRFAGSTGDVARMAQNYAGVSGGSDDRNDIIVRGNSPSAVLWRMEGVDIPSPNHFSTIGATGGPISMLNSNNLRNSDFLSSAFPAEYGNVTGAVFDLNLRNGNADKHEFLGQIGFNGFEGGIEGPLKLGKQSSFLVNYRYSTLGVFSALGINFGTGAAIPEYQDLNFKFNVPTEKAGRFVLWGLLGKSAINFDYAPEEENLFTEVGQIEESQYKGSTGIIGFSHLYFFNEKTSSKLAITATGTQNTFGLQEAETEEAPFEDVYAQDSYQNRVGVNWTVKSKLNARNKIKAGLIFDAYDINLRDSVLADDDVWYSQLNFEGASQLYRAFASWQHRFSEKLRVNSGVHASYFALNETTAVEPRINLAYKNSPRSTIAIGYGLHSQLQPLPVYFSSTRTATPDELAANRNLDFTRSHHAVVSWDYSLTADSRIKLEAYYQQLYNAAVDPADGSFSMLNFGADFGFPNRVGLTNDGVGGNLGMELTLERFLKKGFYYLLTASVFESKFEGTDNIERNTFFNSNYVVNALAGKEIYLNDKFALTFDARFTLSGGRRYTPIDLEASLAAGEEVRDETRRFQEQFDPYIRPDIKIGFRTNGKKVSQTWFIDLQNFIGRQNVFNQSFNEQTGLIQTTYQRGFFPDVRYQILF